MLQSGHQSARFFGANCLAQKARTDLHQLSPEAGQFLRAQLLDGISAGQLQAVVARPLALALARQVLATPHEAASLIASETIHQMSPSSACFILTAIAEEGKAREDELRSVSGKVSSLVSMYLSHGPNDSTGDVFGCLEAWTTRGLSLDALQEHGLLATLLEALSMPELLQRSLKCIAAACGVEAVPHSRDLVVEVVGALVSLMPQYEAALAEGDEETRVQFANAIVACGATCRMHFFSEPPPAELLQLAEIALHLVDDPSHAIVEATFPLWDTLTDATPTPTPEVLGRLFNTLVVHLLHR